MLKRIPGGVSYEIFGINLGEFVINILKTQEKFMKEFKEEFLKESLQRVVSISLKILVRFFLRNHGGIFERIRERHFKRIPGDIYYRLPGGFFKTTHERKSLEKFMKEPPKKILKESLDPWRNFPNEYMKDVLIESQEEFRQ